MDPDCGESVILAKVIEVLPGDVVNCLRWSDRDMDYTMPAYGQRPVSSEGWGWLYIEDEL